MKQKITRKEMMPLVGMTVSAFIFNTSEFMPIGLLTDIAKEFAISEAKAGGLITAYSWVVMLLSLPLILLVSKIDFRKLFMGTIALFGVCQMASVLSPSYAVLMASRIGVACTHAIFWSIASPVAVRLVDEKHRSFALSMVVTGTSIATIAGLPLGRLIGQYIGWRITFLVVAVIAFAVLVYMAFVFPKVAPGEQFHVRDLPSLLRNPVLIALYVQTILFVVGYYTAYSYIEPFLQQVAGMKANVITLTLLIFGAMGLLGSYLFSKLYDSHRYVFIGVTMASLAVWLLLLLPASSYTIAVIAVCACWGITVMAFSVTTQSEVLRCTTEESSAVAMSMYSGLFNLGIGTGSWLGGAVCDHGAISSIGFVGAAFAALSVAFYLFVLMPKLKTAGRQ